MYIDGVQNYNVKTLTNANLVDTSKNLTIGRLNASHYANEIVDDVRFYNRPLSSAEILAIYNATK